MEATPKRTKAPGLRWKGDKPLWRASRQAVLRGYIPKNVPLTFIKDNERELIARCNRLQIEMLEWLEGVDDSEVRYDGTFGSLFDCWTKDADSGYHNLKRQGKRGKHPYDSYLPNLKQSIGKLRPESCDGRDLRRWFKAWKTAPDGTLRPAAARMALCVLKAALSYGKSLKMRGCNEFKSVIEDMRFEGVRRRKTIVTAEQIIAARHAAHEIGHPRLALCYSIQFETFLRQYDVAGVWRPFNDPSISSIVSNGEKWVGPTWADIDANLIFTVTPSKTENLKQAPEDVKFDLKVCPMVMEELVRIPIEERNGPLIIDMRNGQPYSQWLFRNLWRQCADKVGITRTIQNRDLRAGGLTEADQAGARLQDASKQAAHRKQQTTAVVYQRDTLEAHRRNAALRRLYRENKDENL